MSNKIITSVLVLFSLSFTLHGQSESDQKRSFRSSKNTTINRSNNQLNKSNNTYNIERQEKYDVRRNSNNNYRENRTRGGNVIIHRNPWIHRNRNLGWWWSYQPNYLYYNDWYWYDNGYRQPARIYVYPEGRTDTVRVVRPIFRIGIQYKTDNQIGGWITIGNKIYFIGEFNTSFDKDESIFYDNIFMEDVIGWNDERLPDIQKNQSFYFGIGSKIKRFGVHFLIGFNKEIYNYQFFDELYILSNNGKYSFNNYKENNPSLKIGGLYDYKNISLKTDYDFLLNNLTIGMGFNF